jgi:hypothetical protein
MIELMLEAERALAVGLLDQAERNYALVVASDPRNAIAIVGLARVALERGDQAATYRYARQALALDPDNPAASHLARRMGEQFAMRGEPLPGDAPGAAATSATGPGSSGAPSTRPSILDRLRGRTR